MVAWNAHYTIGGTHGQPGNRRAKTTVRSRILPIAFSLVLGGVSVACAQLNYDFSNGIRLAYVGGGPPGAAAIPCDSTGGFTNQHVTLHSAPASTDDPAPELSYSVPPSQPRGEVELSQPCFTSRIRFAGMAETAAPQGWRIGGGGVLNYTPRNQRWHLVFGYAPDLTALREHFDRVLSFNLVWQFSLGKLKPASWASKPTGSELVRPPMVASP
jgi:hypothetical protein